MKQRDDTNAAGRWPVRTRKDNHVTFLNLYIDSTGQLLSEGCSSCDLYDIV